MKIYTKMVLDIDTGATLHEESFEYDGPVAECKGGGSSTVNSTDPAYDARMATISESQQAMAEDYFNYYKTEYQPLQTAQIEADKQLLPYQTAQAQQSLQSQMEVSPYQTEAAKGLLYNNIKGNAEAAPVVSEYYKQALKGVDVNGKVNQARSDVAQGFADTNASQARNDARMGIAPGSARSNYESAATGIQKAQAIGSAMTTARNNAQEENFNRLQAATTTNTQRNAGIVGLV